VKPVSIPVPKEIGPYKVLRPVAQGGMAAVFEVLDPQSGERQALKLLTHRGLATPRFRREYEALTRLDHPNIVRVFRYGTHEGNPFLTMELLDGVPVQVHAKGQGRPGTPRRTAEMLRVVTKVASALAYLHDRGIIHRDLKSANVLVLSDGRVKLLDFGTARFLGATQGITRQGEFVGTFAYASPEQIRGAPLDPRSDLYSLGALFYRLITGKRVFEGDSPHDVARMHIRTRPVPPIERVPALPEGVSDLVMHLLEKEPDDRPASARVLVEMLNDPDFRVADVADRRRVGLRSQRLIGRDKEMEALKATLNKARPARMLMVVGQPGSGRERFLRAAEAEVRLRGWRVYGGRFVGGPGLDALAEVTEDAWSSFSPGQAPELDRAMEQLRQSSWGQDMTARDAEGRARVYDVLAKVLVRRCKEDEAPVIVSLGDLQRASPAALEAITNLRQRIREADEPVLLLATATLDSDLPGTVIRQRFPDAWRQELRALNPQEVGELVGLLLGSLPPGPELASRLHRATGGMPGFVQEVVRAMIQDRQVVARTVGERVAWVDRSGGHVSIPGSVREAVALRLDALPREQVRVLEALAVVGGGAGVEALSAGCGLPEATVSSALDALTHHRFLRSSELMGETRWEIALGIASELVAERTRASRRFVLRRQLSQALRDDMPSAHKVLLMAAAGHLEAAVSDGAEWAEPLLDDGRAAQVLPVLQEVNRVVGGAEGVSRAILARFHLLRARALGDLRPASEEVDIAFRRATAVAVTGAQKGEVDLYESRVRVVRGELAEARNLLDRASTRLAWDGAPALKARVQMDLGSLHWHAGAFEAAGRCYEHSLAGARDAGVKRDLARALVGRAVVRIATGGLSRAEDELREAAAIYLTIGDLDGQWHAFLNLADILRHRANFTEALELLLKGVNEREAISPMRYAFLALNAAEIETEMFQLGRARERLDSLEAEMGGTEHLLFRGALGLCRARIALAAGDPGQVLPLLEPLVRATDEADLQILASHLRAYLGEAQIGACRFSAGEANLAEAIRRLDRAGHMPPLAEACAARARALGDKEDPELIFAPVLPWLEKEPALLVRMEYLLTSARYAEAVNNRSRARALYRTADGLLQQILEREDPAVMSVHPWLRAIQKGLEL
jgi:tetratricopeptide (TPR) repeat protein